jgi:diketogulonate reductase-like aldo/keto reductase
MDKNILLNDGNSIPQIGFGALRIDDDAAEDIIYTAIKSGYRHIDGAAGYYNEQGVGRGIAKALAAGIISREDLWITSKIRDSKQGYNSAFEAVKQTLNDMQLDYLDMYMIHWPVPQQDRYIDTWRAFERLQRDGLVKTIAVSNFLPEYLERLLDNSTVVPAVNQLEVHPSFQQLEATAYTASHGIAVQAYSPLGRGLDLTDLIISQIAQRLQKTAAQIILRWHLQQDRIIIPKASTPARMQENLNIFNFELTDNDMKALTELDRLDGSMGHDPHTYSYS